MHNLKISLLSGIRDNREHGSVAVFLREKIRNGLKSPIVSTSFTTYAYGALKDELDGTEWLQFLFGEPSFVHSIDPNKTNKKGFAIEEDGVQLKMKQRRVVKKRAEWIEGKVDIRSVRQSNRFL